MTKTTPTHAIPDFGPLFAFWSKQTELALYVNTQMMKAALAPWSVMGVARRHGMTAPTPAVAQPATAAPPVAGPAPANAAEDVPAAAAPAPAAATPTPDAASVPDATPAREAAPEPGPSQPEPATAATNVAAPVPAATAESVPADAAPADAASAPDTSPAMRKPAGLDAPRGGVGDSLRAIKGLGPKLEEALNAIGIYHYDQIAAFDDAEVAWVDESIGGVRGRCSRDDWRGQAAALARGDTA